MAPSVKLAEATDRVGAGIDVFRHHVAGIVDHVGVVADTAAHVSAPAPPSRMLLPALPVIMLARLLPVPLNRAVPVRVRFSTLAPSV